MSEVPLYARGAEPSLRCSWLTWRNQSAPSALLAAENYQTGPGTSTSNLSRRSTPGRRATGRTSGATSPLRPPAARRWRRTTRMNKVSESAAIPAPSMHVAVLRGVDMPATSKQPSSALGPALGPSQDHVGSAQGQILFPSRGCPWLEPNVPSRPDRPILL